MVNNRSVLKYTFSIISGNVSYLRFNFKMFTKVHIIVALIDMCVHIYECLKTFLTNLANSHELKRVDLLARYPHADGTFFSGGCSLFFAFLPAATKLWPR